MDQFLVSQTLFFQVEWTTILAVLVAATFYFLAPLVGYPPSKRTLLAAALWLLVMKMAIGVFGAALLGFAVMNGQGQRVGGRVRLGLLPVDDEYLLVAVHWLAMVIFVVAMIIFVLGLQRLTSAEQLPRYLPPYRLPPEPPARG